MTTRALARPDAILFDIGDTLVPAMRIADEALTDTARWLERRSPGIGAEAFADAYRRVDAARHGLSVNHMWGLPLDIAVDACAASGLSRHDALFAHAFYRDRVRARIEPNHAHVRLFGRLVDEGVAVGVVSDGTPIGQMDTLAMLGLLEFVAVAAISQELGTEKPDPRLFRWALARLGVEPGRAWFVGNHPERDYDGAERVGLSSIIVGEAGDGDYRRVADVEEVGRLLDAARGRRGGAGRRLG